MREPKIPKPTYCTLRVLVDLWWRRRDRIRVASSCGSAGIELREYLSVTFTLCHPSPYMFTGLDVQAPPVTVTSLKILHAKHQCLVGDVYSSPAEVLRRLGSPDSCILERKGEFKHFCDGEERRWKYIFHFLWNRKQKSRDFSNQEWGGCPHLALSDPFRALEELGIFRGWDGGGGGVRPASPVHNMIVPAQYILVYGFNIDFTPFASFENLDVHSSVVTVTVVSEWLGNGRKQSSEPPKLWQAPVERAIPV
ncbi:hypothetical protein C8R44DRAFT_946238 [Mycena epipterygia]|nr:hypothetical protein C8R44DRAFT_946238 [Mycena epipterygia]